MIVPESDGRQWYKAEESEVYAHVVSAFRRLDRAQDYRKRRNLRNLRASGMRVEGLGPTRYARRDETEQPRYNCIEAAIDALVSHIGSNKPSPYFLTDSGDYRAQRQAELCTKAVVGQFYAAKTYALGRKMLTDALRMDGGVIKSLIRDGEVHDRIVFPNDLLIDDVEAYHGRPRHYLEIEYCDREELIEDIKDDKKLSAEEKEAKIEAVRGAGRVRDDDWGIYEGLADAVAVIHAYWLPVHSGKMGKYARVVDTATLSFEDWDETWAPYTIHAWMEGSTGVWGKGFAEQASGAQRRLDANMRKIGRLVTLGTMKVYIDRMARIDKAALNNEDLGIIEGNGPNPPRMLSTLSIPAELFQQNEWLRSSIYEMAGISQLMLAARVQPGMESAVGVRAVADQQAGRFRKASDALDETYMEAARKHIALAKKIPGYKVLAQDEDHAYEVAWDTLDPKVLGSRIKVWPTNLMQGSPAYQIEQAERIAKLGIVTPRTLLRLLKIKDVESATNALTASERVMEMLIERMLDPDNPQYKGPEPFMDLPGALRMAQEAYLQAWIKGVPKISLDMLMDFMRATKAEIDKITPAPVVNPAAPVPPGVPPPPTTAA